jgi:hypothetical protein
MSVSSDARREAELESGRKRLAEIQAMIATEEPAPVDAAEPAPVDPAEPVVLTVTGVGNFEAGQAVGPTVVSDAKAYTAEELDAVIQADGIEGLRAIATPLGIHGKSKNELKAELLAFFAKA